MRRCQLVISVEHASHAVPRSLGNLGLHATWLESHHGWDPGAAEVGRLIRRRFGAPLHLGRWTRLVADLNRSAHHARVVPPTTGPLRIAANDLDRAARLARLREYWQPYRGAVEADLDAVVARHGQVLHLSIHSFTDRIRGERRAGHFGLLYKPAHREERAMADRWDGRLRRLGFKVRRNWPYSGLDDGFCMRMRAERDWSSYLGMEVEMNQRWVRRPEGVRRFGAALIDVLDQEFDD